MYIIRLKNSEFLCISPMFIALFPNIWLLIEAQSASKNLHIFDSNRLLNQMNFALTEKSDNDIIFPSV